MTRRDGARPSHPAVRGLDWSKAPPLLGFNEAGLREGAEALVEIGNQGSWHPLLAERAYGKGRVTCWMTGASPHWGINFMAWRDYPRFWRQLFAAQ